MRIIKEPQERRNEILDTAEMFFCTKGYARTTINDILQEIGIAKGTFYYYFKSKEELMDAIIIRFVDLGTAKAKEIAANPNLTVHEKLFQSILAQKPDGANKDKITEQLHQAGNAEMHQKSLIETVLRLTPVLAEVVKQGIRERAFNTPYPIEVMEILLISGQFLFDDATFRWTPDEMAQRIQAFIHTMETLLGAEKGSFFYVAKLLEPIDGRTTKQDEP